MARRNTPRSAAHGQGFTLIELLVVIGIIGILIAVSLAAGTKVVASAKGASTGETLRILQQSLDAYIDQRDELPGPYAIANKQSGIGIALSDAPPPEPTDPDQLKLFNNTPNGLSWFIFQIQQVDKASGSSTIIDTINSKVRSTQLNDADVIEIPQGGSMEGSEVKPPTTGWKTVRIYDAWGKQIRFVHPKLSGEYKSMPIIPPSTTSTTMSLLPYPEAPLATIYAPFYNGKSEDKLARSADPTGAKWGPANSDGGACIGGRPYFYSEGGDGKAWDTADNVYSSKPRLPVYKN